MHLSHVPNIDTVSIEAAHWQALVVMVQREDCYRMTQLHQGLGEGHESTRSTWAVQILRQ
jgi:hypothetical protein